MTMFAKTVAERTKPGVRQDIEEKQYTFHAYASSQGVAGIIITDPTYPKMVAHGVLSKMMDEFTSAHPRSQYGGTNVEPLAYPQLKEYIVKYQNPEEADSIMKIQQELDATKVSEVSDSPIRIADMSITIGCATQNDTERACKFCHPRIVARHAADHSASPTQEREEKLDTLIEKSNELSGQSKMFYTQAKKQNSCCLVM
jgi:synaptobrevin homolog YKT6